MMKTHRITGGGAYGSTWRKPEPQTVDRLCSSLCLAMPPPMLSRYATLDRI